MVRCQDILRRTLRQAPHDRHRTRQLGELYDGIGKAEEARRSKNGLNRSVPANRFTSRCQGQFWTARKRSASGPLHAEPPRAEFALRNSVRRAPYAFRCDPGVDCSSELRIFRDAC